MSNPAFLMCPPTYFDVSYSINPWMTPGAPVDRDLARTQWDDLRRRLIDAGATVALIDPVPGLPDMVFAANYGLVDGTRFLAANYRHAERQAEAAAAISWFEARGYECLSPGAHFEGGEVFTCAGRVWIGYGIRTSEAGVAGLGALLGSALTPLRLIDPGFYHLDTCFCPLDERTALVAPDALDAPSRDLIARSIPEIIAMERDEAMSLAANSVVVGQQVLMPQCPPRIARILERMGYEPTLVDLSELLKAGGAARCMVLPIDTSLPPAREQPSSATR